MIGFVLDAVRTRILAPQGDELVDEDVRAIVDPDGSPITIAAAELTIVGATSQPVSREIGGTGIIRHIVGIVLVVEDGDLEEAHRRRDAIVTDLVLRVEGDRALGGAESADGRQIVSSVGWTVDYGDLEGDTLAAFASLTLTVEADLTR